MFDIEPNKPGSNTDIIMGIGTKNRSAYSKNLDLVLDSSRNSEETNTTKKKGTDLFIDINLAKARDMTYNSPEAWRKYLLMQ